MEAEAKAKAEPNAKAKATQRFTRCKSRQQNAPRRANGIC